MLRPTLEAFQLLHDGALALANVEAAGARIDEEYLDRTIKETELEIKERTDALKAGKLYQRWKKEFGDRTRIGSRDQLGHILYKVLNYPCPAVTATGKAKTDEEAFDDIDIPFVKKWLTVQGLKKTLTTYLLGIKNATVDGYIHPSYNLNIAKTYRSSSSDPNFTNLPVRDPVMGKTVRTAFIPRKKGWQIAEVDCKILEVRVSACYNKDPVLITYVKDKTKDMHRDMSIQSYMLEDIDIPPEWWKDKTPTGGVNVRYCAKNRFVFPEFYGAYYINVARALWKSIDQMHLTTPTGESLKTHLKRKGIRELGALNDKEKPLKGTFEYHIQKVEEDFWQNRFKVYTDWKESWWKKYQKNCGFRMFTGFVVNGYHKRNDVLNYPIQGAAFHILLYAIIKLDRWLRKHRFETVIIGQIHDSIITDGPTHELQDVLQKIKQLITEVIPREWEWMTVVPFEVEAEVAPPGESWYSKKGVEL